MLKMTFFSLNLMTLMSSSPHHILRQKSVMAALKFLLSITTFAKKNQNDRVIDKIINVYQ